MSLDTIDHYKYEGGQLREYFLRLSRQLYAVGDIKAFSSLGQWVDGSMVLEHRCRHEDKTHLVTLQQ